MRSIDLSNKVAVVTGGSRGLGREMVLAFAEAGADVVIASRKLEACEAVAREVEKLGRKALPVAAHVGTWADNDKLAEAAYAKFGRVDILVNNAGMSPLAPSLLETSEALFDKVIDVNFKGPFRLSTLIGERMVKGDGGAIINLSSTAAFKAEPHTIPYGGAKAAINVMTVALAKAFGPKVRVNCIAPGPFLTDVSTVWRENKTYEKSLGLQRFGRPEEIVGTALYLASDASSYTTGTVIRVDGGTW
ncbi:MAG: SDR family oxidoreductase [Alphaproteobacteria bacterium]|nr:SDR family oxidoreductase [Alphaproteobacteria bacterium]MBN9571258.1 SDR family oxidoreductase [Alphaproteobacteria bacterium]MBN9578649.1 SDR family oxidoreductase [Alphaproteobacteria bacterium]